MDASAVADPTTGVDSAMNDDADLQNVPIKVYESSDLTVAGTTPG
jgi:hypothetical protein